MSRLNKWVLKTFYQNELTAICQEYEHELEKIRREAHRQTKLIDVVRNVFIHPNYAIVGVENNKKGEEFLVVQWIYNKEIWIMLYSDKYDGSCSQPRIMATYEKPYGEPEYIHIDDILIEDIEKGNGSILMQYFLKYCKTTSAEYVSGMLSPIDADHFDRSEHYYKKHGFTVVFFDEKKSGSIRYELRGQKHIL